MIFLPRVPWLILPVFSHRQRSMLSADETGITGPPQKSCTFKLFSLSLTRRARFARSPASLLPWHPGPLGKNEVLARKKITLQRWLIVFLLNWQSAMSDGRTSLSREANLSLQLDELKDYDLSNWDAICCTSLSVNKRMTNRRRGFIFMGCVCMRLSLTL